MRRLGNWRTATMVLLALWLARGWTVLPARSDEALIVERDCVAPNNLDEIAQTFIGRCCQGKIRREFPTEWLDKTLGEIFRAKQGGHASARRAWKLLDRCEYKK
jgi:hypothetical protein